MKCLEIKIGRKYAKMSTMVIPNGGIMGYVLFLLFCTVLYFASSLQTSTCKLCKEKQRKAVLSQLFIVSIFCGNSEEKSLPYFKGHIKLVTI